MRNRHWAAIVAIATVIGIGTFFLTRRNHSASPVADDKPPVTVSAGEPTREPREPDDTPPSFSPLGLDRCEQDSVPTGTYEVRSMAAAGIQFGEPPPTDLPDGNMCLDLRSQDVDKDDASIQKVSCNNLQFQRFRFGDRNGVGCFKIRAMGAPPDYAMHLEWDHLNHPSAELRAFRNPTGSNERLPYWNVIKAKVVSDGFVVRLMSQADKLCLDFTRELPAGATVAGAVVREVKSLDCRENREQYWHLVGPR